MLHYLKKSSGLKGGWGFQNSPPLRYFLGKRPQLVGDPQSPKYCDGPLRRSAKRDARTQLLMRQMLDWLKQNKEWVFSGVGVAVLAAIFGLIKSRSGALLLGRPKLQVSLKFGLIFDGPYLSDQMLLFKVHNPAQRPVQITAIRITLKGGRNLIFPALTGERRLPCAVDPDNNVNFWTEVAEVRRALIADGYVGRAKVRAIVSDASDGEHKSNRV